MKWHYGSRQFDCLNVDHPGKKTVIGILGGIASGKSTVARELGRLGCAVISADEIAHELLREEAVRAEIIRLFGPEVESGGVIDRRKLAKMVFSDEKKLSALNNVIHPRVLARTEELIAQYNDCTSITAIVLDMPLLIEVGWANRCDRLLFVKCNPERRAERAEREGLSGLEIKIREKSQISLDKKAKLADNTIDNNSDFLTLVRQIKKIFSDIARSR
jgi:dephospho-CoA kinase